MVYVCRGLKTYMWQYIYASLKIIEMNFRTRAIFFIRVRASFCVHRSTMNIEPCDKSTEQVFYTIEFQRQRTEHLPITADSVTGEK